MDGGGAAAATLQVLVQNLINVSKEEFSLIRGLEKNADKLKDTLDMIQGYLNDAEGKFITEEAVRSWLWKLEAVAFDADTVLGELSYDILAKKMKSIIKADMKAEKKKAPSCFPSFNHYLRRRQMALKIKEINTSFESINKKATELGLQKIFMDAPTAPDNAGHETDSFALDPIFIGRDNDVKEIVEMLTGSPVEQVFCILPIVGMGGLGKTTVARKVYHDEKIRARYGKHIWVHVSKTFDPILLFKKILENITGNDEVGSREALLTKLKEALKDKTCLLVLDDIWNEDKREWDDFISSLSGISSTKGNGIIVTTRNIEVASVVKTSGIHRLRGLSEEDCWSIIKGKAFEGGDIPSTGFETLGRKIAGRCQGLPLAASVVGGVLRGKSEDDWLSVQQNWLSDSDHGGDDNISKILKLSYDNLSSPSLKKCFAYCSIFPKGNEIDRQELIELWMAEGFLRLDQQNDMETTGTKFFKLLLQNSLLQVVKREDNGDVTLCSMHDLVHDLARSLLNPKANENSNGIVRYIRHEDDGGPIPKEKAKCLRTLFFEDEISDTIILDFKCLHALTLICDADELPSSIGKLIHLRFLRISNKRIRHLPGSIGELYHLQTFILNFRSTSAVSRQGPLVLPSTLKYLISLRHLHLDGNIKFPHGVGRLTSLQTLPHFPVGKQRGHQIVELGGLKHLKGNLTVRNLENVIDKEEAKSAHLFGKPNIVKLVLRWGISREGEANDDENVLEGLQPHPNLKSLEIAGFRGACFPLWTLKMAVEHEVEGHWVGLNNLTEIKLYSCEECEEIPMLGHLPHLKYLNLEYLTNVRSIGSSFYGINSCNSNSEVCKETIILFPALKRLRLWWMPNLTQWVEAESPNVVETQSREVKIFPLLELLEISWCWRLASAPSQFPSLKELKISNMDSGLPLANICGSKPTSLTKLTIEEIDGLESVSDWLFYNNKNLTVLTINDCRNLTELPDCLQTLNSLEELSIVRCQNLKSLRCSSGGLTSLRSLEIIDCRGLTNLPCEMIESNAQSLVHLVLRDLPSVTNSCMVIDRCLQKMPRLTTLEIHNVPQSIEIATFSSWQELRIGPCPDSTEDCDCGTFNKTVDWILLQRSQSLDTLKLSGMEHWDSLPHQLQCLTCLSSLCLENFGIETLPEWFGNLSSLKELFLVRCEKLRCMPSKEATQRLANLQHLQIRGCPLLEERCNIEQQKNDDSDSDSEWPKISHILRVTVGKHTFYHG